MIKIVLQSLARRITSIIKYTNTNQPSHHQKKQQLLETIASKIKIDLKPAIFISDEDHKTRKLSHQQKLQLGLYLPKSPFNHRLTKSAQKQYLPTLTKQLYLQQQHTLPLYFRILQNNLFLQDTCITLDHYVNLIYKDIYARYLVSRGVGVQWNGYCADQGVINPHNSQQYDLPSKIVENRSILLDFIENQSKLIRQKKTIGLYSYRESKFVHLNKVEVQKIKKLGYYIKQQLSQFASFTEQFQVLKQRNSKVSMLIFVQHLEQLINPNAVCVNNGDRFLILKTFNTQSNTETEYLILALETYNQHERYFKDNKYQKHSTFDSKYLLGMKVMGLPIISQIQGYERPPKSYIVNSNCHIADYQRANAHNIQHNVPPVNQLGEIIINGKPSNLFVSDFKTTKKLQQILPQQGYQFMDLYDTFDDEVYYHQTTKDLLKFRLGNKYFIEIGQNNASNIMEGLKREGTIIAQSKIAIPRMRPGKRPREKRAFRKQRKQMVGQMTEHYSLQQSLQQINSITISSLSQSLYTILLFSKNEEVLPYSDVLSEQQLNGLSKSDLPQQVIARIVSKGIKITQVFANEDLIMSLLYLQNIKKSKQTLNVIIEPQTQTEILIPSALHLNYLINRAKQTRRTNKHEIKNNINLIKLHPTFSEQHRTLNIRSMIEGAIKSNSQEQYGLGFEALRLWTAKNDHILGDRSISQKDLNSELRHSEHIRRVFWDLLSLLPQKTAASTAPQLYINKFMLDSIDCYIHRMEQCYKQLNIHMAYQLTCDFFYNIIHEIYVKSIRKRILAYPNHQQNQEHFTVIRRIMELAAVAAPLFPFSAYHISKKQLLRWPQIQNEKFHESLLLHNQMIRKRVAIFNKLYLNDLTHATLFCETLKEPFTERDLELFFNIDKVTTKQPEAFNKKCSLKLNKNSCFTQDQKLIFFINEDHCIRCDPRSKQTEHLCSTCVDYLQEQVGEPYRYFPITPHTQIDTS